MMNVGLCGVDQSWKGAGLRRFFGVDEGYEDAGWRGLCEVKEG